MVKYSKKYASLQMPGLDGYINVNFQDLEPIKLVNAYTSLELEANYVTRLAFKLDGEVEKGHCVAFEGGFLLNEGLYLPRTGPLHEFQTTKRQLSKFSM